MDSISNNILYNNLTVSNIEKTDQYEGYVTFTTSSLKEISAYFWGTVLEINQKYKVQFSFLDYPLDWDIIFSENKKKEQSLEAASIAGSYHAYGKILSINPVIADFGQIIMEIGDWTHDERVVGEFIYYKIERLDVLDVKPST